MTPFLAGLALGVAGSAHCIAMCGPLVLAFGRRQGAARAQEAWHAATYHGARILMYAAIGAPLGLAGHALAVRGFGRALAATAAMVLLAAAVGSAMPALAGRAGSGLARVTTRLSMRASRWSRAHPVAGPFVMGAAHGLLPCGLVYVAAAAAAATGSAAGAASLMAGFGAGTTPALLAVMLTAAAVPPLWRSRLRRLTPAVLALAAALLFARAVAPGHTPHAPHHTASHATAPE